MKKIITFLSLFFISYAYSQEVKSLLDQNKVEEALDYINSEENLTAEDYYYASMLYHQKGYDQEATKFIQLALEKEKSAEYYQFLAFLQNKEGNCEATLESLNNVYKLEPSNQILLMEAKVYNYCFEEPNYDKSITLYKEVLKTEPNIEAVQSLSLLYTQQERYKQAHSYLEGLTTNKRFADHKDYIQFINATLYFEEQKYERAEEELNALLKRDPNDYISIAKLIQIRYAQDRAQETNELRERLYKGYETKQLPEFIKDKYQFDEFKINGNIVKAFEDFKSEDSYSEGDQTLYKYIFEVYDAQNKFMYTIQTEYSSAIPMYKKYNLDYNYYLGKTVYGKKYEHFNFGPQKINITTDYSSIKQSVTDIIEGKLQPQKNSKTVVEKF